MTHELNFFNSPSNSLHKQYEALRAFFVEKQTAQQVADRFDYKILTVYSLARNFKNQLKSSSLSSEHFFHQPKLGRKLSDNHGKVRSQIISLRKKYLSVPDIKSILDSQNATLSERHIHTILKEEGFARLPRRSKIEKQNKTTQNIIVAPKAELLENINESFHTLDAGLLIFLCYIKQYGIDLLIENSFYPGTKQIPKINSILAFIGLKLSNVRRYSSDDLWCMDRGLGLFAGLNVLPKTAWYTSYSSRITRDMNLAFLKAMHQLWIKHGLLSDTINMDFVTVPYWGEENHLENNWSGTRHHALASVLATLAHDPDSGIITYGDATVRHENESNIAIEFLDFYKKSKDHNLKYLVFDSKFTTYQNLSKLDDNKVKFITIRRRGKKIIEKIETLPEEQWKQIKVPASKGKNRKIKVHDSSICIESYGKNKIIRQIVITGHGKIKPALIISNDFDISANDIVKKYAKRWLVEKTISEQTHFFHLNRLSSSMVIKVDFDLTMTVLAHNLYRLLANDLLGFQNNTSQALYEKFIHNEGYVTCKNNKICVQLKKKRNLPLILEAIQQKSSMKFKWLNNRQLIFEGATTT
jgi:DNA-binding transcriptional MerR regulator